MSKSLIPSIFDEIRASDKYGWQGNAAILYVLIVKLLILFMGMALLASYISSFANHPQFTSYTLFAPALSAYLILATVLGVILRGKFGWMLTLSCCYFTFGFSLQTVRNGVSLFTLIGCSIAAFAIALMHSYHLKRFYKAVPEQKPLITHVYAFLMGAVTAIMWSFTLD